MSIRGFDWCVFELWKYRGLPVSSCFHSICNSELLLLYVDISNYIINPQEIDIGLSMSVWKRGEQWDDVVQNIEDDVFYALYGSPQIKFIIITMWHTLNGHKYQITSLSFWIQLFLVPLPQVYKIRDLAMQSAWLWVVLMSSLYYAQGCHWHNNSACEISSFPRLNFIIIYRWSWNIQYHL